MFQFESPLAALLLLLPFLTWLIPFRHTEKGALELHFPSLKRLKSSKPRSLNNRLFYSLFFPAWICLVLALMQPEKVDQFRQVRNKGYDLMLAVDISASMQAVDFSTPTQTISRLDATKDVVGNFVLGREGDRVGLVTFGAEAYLHVPLTLDTLAVSKSLNDTVSGMAGNATAIGDAIGLSVKTLRTRPEGSRVLVLLTDGEDNASSIPPLEAAKLAKQYGIRIYTVGIGTNGLVPFPTQNGGHALAKVTIDEALLKEIARITDGEYFLAADQKALRAIYDRIDALEKTEYDQTIFLVREPLYYYPLSLAMILLLALSILQLRRRAHAL